MATNAKQTGIVGKLETVMGTRVEPQAADSDVILFGEPKVTLDFGNESAGKLADGTFNDAPVVGGLQKMTIGDFMFHLLKGTTAQTEPKAWKYLKMAGGVVKTKAVTLEKSILWDGVPDCQTVSMDVQTIGCDKKGQLYKGKGMRANCTISWEGANSPVMVTITGATGSYVSVADVATNNPYAVTGDDAYTGIQKASSFSVDFGGTVYQVNSFTFSSEFDVTYEIANSASGIAKAVLTGQSKKISLSMLQLSVGDNMIAKAQANDVIDIIATGSTGVDFEALDCQIVGTPTIDEIEGLNSWTAEMQVKSFEIKQK
jgi:hypothetical protein